MAFALPLVLCFVLLEQRRYLPAAVLYGLALAIKPQAMLFGPVLAVCYLAAITWEKDRLRAFGRCFGGAALALLPPLLTGLPFFGVVQLIPKLIDKDTVTTAGYPYATINAFNWLAALGGNWKGQADPALFGISWQQLGCFHILLVTAGLAYGDPGHGYFGSLDVQCGFCGMTGWRLGWAILPDEPTVLEAVDDLATNYYLCAHTPTQHAALACFTPESLAECEARRQELLARRRIVIDGLKRIGLPGEVEPNGAVYAYFDISRTGLDAWTFCERALDEAHVALTPGRDFGAATADTHVRLSYAASREALTEGLERLGTFVESL